MKLLCFGDPEGLLQRRRMGIEKIIEKYKPDFVIFLGDYYSNQITYQDTNTPILFMICFQKRI